MKLKKLNIAGMRNILEFVALVVTISGVLFIFSHRWIKIKAIRDGVKLMLSFFFLRNWKKVNVARGIRIILEFVLFKMSQFPGFLKF